MRCGAIKLEEKALNEESLGIILVYENTDTLRATRSRHTLLITVVRYIIIYMLENMPII